MEEILKALAIGAPAFILALLAYRRSRQVDAVSERTGIATETRAGQIETREGQESLIANLQADNALFRQELKDLKIAFAALEREVNRLYRKYGESGS